jgi:hypothetical protein
MNAALTESPPAVPEIRDIAPPIDVFPYPLWMVLTALAIALILLGLAAWLFIRWWKKRPKPAPPTPRAIAMRELDSLRARLESIEPYRFSIAVSDVLRGFIAAQYGLRATKQTSPEFLASMAKARQFTEDDRTLLTEFLERCDLIKFAHVDATSADSSELLRSAIAFVQGVRA